MLKIDDNLLKDLGLGDLPLEERDQLLALIYEKLEVNVGARLADEMSDEQLVEFEKFVDSGDEKEALKWLEKNFPHYPQTVKEELEKIKAQIKQDSESIKNVARESRTTFES